MSRTRINQLLIGVTLALGACTPMPRSGSSGPRAGHAMVAVQNNFAETLAIYAMSTGGASIRLGTVASAARGTVSVPRMLLTEPGGLRLLARPIGPGTALTLGCGTIRPGASVELVLDRTLAFSNCWVR